jgi:hypothetical protein
MRLANALCRFAEVAISLDRGAESGSSNRVERLVLTLGL